MTNPVLHIYLQHVCACRLELALHGWCSEDCEDVLQHFISVHLGSRDAATDLSLQDGMSDFRNESSATTNINLSAAVFLHQRFARLMHEYSDAINIRHLPWLTVKLPEQA